MDCDRASLSWTTQESSLAEVTVCCMSGAAPGPKERVAKRCFRGTGCDSREGSSGVGGLNAELTLPVMIIEIGRIGGVRQGVATLQSGGH